MGKNVFGMLSSSDGLFCCSLIT